MESDTHDVLHALSSDSIIRVDPAEASLMLDDFHRSILYVPEEGLVLSGGRAKDVASYSERNVPLTRTIAVDVIGKLFNESSTFA